MDNQVLGEGNFNIKSSKLDIDFYEQFITKDESDNLYKYLEENVIWSKNITPNRRTNQTYGDDGLVYQIVFGGYKGIPQKIVNRQVVPWDNLPVLNILKNMISELTGEKYNFCVIQRYPNGNVGIKPHRDKEMVKGTTICGLSLGSSRILTMTPLKYIKDTPKMFELKPGSLYILKPPTNDHWNHSIESSTCNVPRISLTFRNLPI